MLHVKYVLFGFLPQNCDKLALKMKLMLLQAEELHQTVVRRVVFLPLMTFVGNLMAALNSGIVSGQRRLASCC